MSCGGAHHNGEILEKNASGFALGYFLHSVDETIFPHYYLFIGYSGHYYIMKEDSLGNCLYTRKEFTGRGQWSNDWANRTILTYTVWDNLF